MFNKILLAIFVASMTVTSAIAATGDVANDGGTASVETSSLENKWLDESGTPVKEFIQNGDGTWNMYNYDTGVLIQANRSNAIIQAYIGAGSIVDTVVSVVEYSAIITEDSTRLSTIDNAIAVNQAQTNQNTTDIAGVLGTVNDNAANIATNVASINANTTNVTANADAIGIAGVDRVFNTYSNLHSVWTEQPNGRYTSTSNPSISWDSLADLEVFIAANPSYGTLTLGSAAIIATGLNAGVEANDDAIAALQGRTTVLEIQADENELLIYANTDAIKVNADDITALDTRVDNVDTRIDNVDTRIDGVDTRIDGVDTRIDGVDTRIDNVDTRIDGVDTRIDGVDILVADNTAAINDIGQFGSDEVPFVGGTLSANWNGELFTFTETTEGSWLNDNGLGEVLTQARVNDIVAEVGLYTLNSYDAGTTFAASVTSINGSFVGTGEFGKVATAINDEADARIADVDAVLGTVTLNADGTITGTGDILTLITSIVTKVNADIAQEVIDRNAAVLVETNARIAEVSALRGVETGIAIIDAATVRGNAIAIVKETTARMAADSILSGRIDINSSRLDGHDVILADHEGRITRLEGFHTTEPQGSSVAVRLDDGRMMMMHFDVAGTMIGQPRMLTFMENPIFHMPGSVMWNDEGVMVDANTLEPVDQEGNVIIETTEVEELEAIEMDEMVQFGR